MQKDIPVFLLLCCIDDSWRPRGSANTRTTDKAERIKIFLKADKSYDWISKELSVSKKTISDIKKSLSE